MPALQPHHRITWLELRKAHSALTTHEVLGGSRGQFFHAACTHSWLCNRFIELKQKLVVIRRDLAIQKVIHLYWGQATRHTRVRIKAHCMGPTTRMASMVSPAMAPMAVTAVTRGPFMVTPTT